MKKILLMLLAFTGLILANNVHAQNIDAVIAGLKAGDTDKISKNIGDNVVLNIAEKSNTYSTAQAVQVLKDFFTKSTVKGFEIKHKGVSPNGNYGIGTLTTKTGNYRVNIFMKKDGNIEVIKELRFQLIE